MAILLGESSGFMRGRCHARSARAFPFPPIDYTFAPRGGALRRRPADCILGVVELVSDLEVFRREPYGRCVAGATWAYFFPDPTFCGFSLWGRPTIEDGQRLARAFELESNTPPHVVYADVRGLTAIEPGAFDALSAFDAKHRANLSAVVTKLALVRPPGLVGALAHGFHAISGAAYPVRAFTSAPAALRWLGLADPRAMLDAIDVLYAKIMGQPPLLRDLQAALELSPRASLEEVAASIGLSPRTLQRRLGEHDTSFRREAGIARVRVAQRLLLDTDAPLTRIAYDVGCASLPHFSALFRRVSGKSPSAWRAENRRR